jgi:hypothetical protein
MEIDESVLCEYLSVQIRSWVDFAELANGGETGCARPKLGSKYRPHSDFSNEYNLSYPFTQIQAIPSEISTDAGDGTPRTFVRSNVFRRIWTKVVRTRPRFPKIGRFSGRSKVARLLHVTISTVTSAVCVSDA